MWTQYKYFFFSDISNDTKINQFIQDFNLSNDILKVQDLLEVTTP
jgi:hypothetical protein